MLISVHVDLSFSSQQRWDISLGIHPDSFLYITAFGAQMCSYHTCLEYSSPITCTPPWNSFSVYTKHVIFIYRGCDIQQVDVPACIAIAKLC
jgi:hypothetical protein